MDSSQAELLCNPHPCRHIVYPYNDEAKAINAVYLFASSGLSKGESVVLIMADSRREPILGQLTSAEFDLAALQGCHRLECISAEKMLDGFLANGALDEQVVKDTIGRVIRLAKASSPMGKVRIFGEMVSLLLARNEVETAERLEELWNEIIQAHSISLLCSYTLVGSGRTILPDSLEKLHSHNLASLTPEMQGASAND